MAVFLTVPFACVFIYEVVKYFVKTDPLKDYIKIIISIIILFLFLAAAFNIDKLYTSVTFFLTAIGLLIHWFIFKPVNNIHLNTFNTLLNEGINLFVFKYNWVKIIIDQKHK